MAGRNRIGIKGQSVRLYVLLRDSTGEAAYADSTPSVSILSGAGQTLRALSSSGVYKNTDVTGLYYFDYTIPEGISDGYATDHWQFEIGGETITADFEFLAIDGGEATEAEEPEFTPSVDGWEASWNKVERDNINYLLNLLDNRLVSSGVILRPNGMGGMTESSCDIFTLEQLVNFLMGSLSSFNSYPHFTNFTFNDTGIIHQFADVLIQGAALNAMAAKALMEKGKEYTFNDNGVSFGLPAVSEVLMTQYTTEFSNYTERVKYIKANMKPAPLAVASWRPTAVAPVFRALRHLRDRRIY